MYAMEPVDKSRNFLPIPYENIRIDWTGDYFQITDDDGAVYQRCFLACSDLFGLNSSIPLESVYPL